MDTGQYREFNYRGFGSLAVPLFGVAWVAFWTVAAVLFLLAGFSAGQPLTALGLALLMLLVGWGVFLVLANSHPSIWLGEQDLMISVVPLGRVRIRYEDVTEVRALGRYSPGTVVTAHRITLLHELYGLTYSRTAVPEPSFVIGPAIQGYDELVRALKERIAQARGVPGGLI
jgi:hypothetical protein